MQKELSETLFYPSKEEQIATFLNLEESDLGSDDSSFDFSDDELYEGLRMDADEEEEEDLDDEETLIAALWEDDFYLDDTFVSGGTNEEDLAKIIHLTGQLKNKREVNMLKLALHEQRPQAVTSAVPPVAPLAPASEPFANPLEGSSFYSDFFPASGVVPSSIHTPLVSSDDSDSDARSDSGLSSFDDSNDVDGEMVSKEEVEEMVEEEEEEEEEAKRASSLVGSDSDSGADSDIDVDVEEELDIDVMAALFTPRPNKRAAKYIEEEEEDSDSDDDDSVMSPLSAPSTPLAFRGRSMQLRPQHQRTTTPVSSRPTSRPSSTPSSRQASRASSPAPAPSRAGRVPSQVEESLLFKIQHLLPAERLPELRHFIEKLTGSPCGEEFATEIGSLSAPRFKEVSDFVQTCIQEEVSASAKKPASAIEELTKQETTPPSTPQSSRKTRSRKEAASPRRIPSESPLHTATSKPLPTTYVAAPTSRTITGHKKQKKEEEEEEEIDVLF